MTEPGEIADDAWLDDLDVEDLGDDDPTGHELRGERSGGSVRDCCAHQPDCPSLRRKSWTRTLLGWPFGGGRR